MKIKISPIIYILSIGSAISLLLFFKIRDDTLNTNLIQFNIQAENIISGITDTLENHINVLTGVKGLYLTSQIVSREEFGDFANLVSESLSEGIQAIEWIPYVLQEDRESLELETRAEGFESFEITERNELGEIVRAGERDEYYPVFYIEPFEGNENAFGFDLGSNNTRLEALNQARDLGDIVLTGRITLVQETGDQFGFLVFSPIYKSNLPTDEIQQRRETLKGFVLGVFRMEDIISIETEAQDIENIHLYINDLSAPQNQQLLYKSKGAPDEMPVPNIGTKQTYAIGQRQWEFSLYPKIPLTNSNNTWQPWSALLIGLLLTGIFGSIIRLNEKQVTENSAKRLNNLLQAAGEAIISIDNKQNIIQFNASAEKIFGYKPEEVLGKPISLLLPEEFRNKHVEKIREFGETGVTIREMKPLSELAGQRKNGQIFPVGVSISRANVRGKKYFTAILRDITNLRKMESEIKENQKELENYAYVVSHDLKAPLRALSNYSRFLIEDYGDKYDEDAREYLKGIEENAIQMNALITDLLEYASIGRSKTDLGIVDLNKVIEKISKNIDHEINIEIPKPLPKIEGYSLRLEQIFSNLIGNAIKFSRPDEKIKITISWKDLGSTKEIIIKDNGIGIEKTHLEKIFGVFQRLHTTDEYEGTGIGLSIVRKAVEEHGGEIRVQSTVGEGSTFIFSIPNKIKGSAL